MTLDTATFPAEFESAPEIRSTESYRYAKPEAAAPKSVVFSGSVAAPKRPMKRVPRITLGMDDATFQRVRLRFFVALLSGVAALSLLVAGFFVAAVPLTFAAACLFLVCFTASAQWLELASRGPSNN